MEYQEENARIVSFISGLILGAALGAGIALLTAPQPGTRTRRKIRRAATHLRDGASDRWDDLADDMKRRVDDTVKSARRRLPR